MVPVLVGRPGHAARSLLLAASLLVPAAPALAAGPVAGPATPDPAAAPSTGVRAEPAADGKAEPSPADETRPLGPTHHMKPRHNWIAPWSLPRPRRV